MGDVKVILLAGGYGRKLWPLARRDFPKPFLKLVNGKSLLRQTTERFLKFFSPEDILIISVERFKFLVFDELQGFGIKNFLFEPEGKGTNYSIFSGMKFALEHGWQDSTLIFSPTDQFIEDLEKFYIILQGVVDVSHNGYLTLIGVQPDYPDPEFGYILPGNKRGDYDEVKDFVEKPSIEIASNLIQRGYLWNTGIFTGKLDTFMNVFLNNEQLKEFEKSSLEDFFASYGKLKPSSFTKEIQQITYKMAVVKGKFGWVSLSSWFALYRWLGKEGTTNVLKGNVTIDGVRNSMFIGDRRKIVALGIEDAVLVETRDAVLLSSLSNSWKLKDVVDILQEKGETEFLEHKTVFRPWGSYTVLEEEEGFKVKRIAIKPGGTLSLQYHNKRSEHWIVVKGKVKTEIDGKIKILERGESTFVPIGKLHRLSNPFEDVAEIVEIQVGDYLGEDDIVRVEDKYGRS